MHFFQNVQLSKDGNTHTVKYENSNNAVYRKISEEEYNDLFQKFAPTIEFSTPDLMIKSLVTDQHVIPSYRTSANYDNEHFDESISHFKDKMKSFIHVMNDKHRNKRRKLKQYSKKMSNERKKAKMNNVQTTLLSTKFKNKKPVRRNRLKQGSRTNSSRSMRKSYTRKFNK